MKRNPLMVSVLIVTMALMPLSTRAASKPGLTSAAKTPAAVSKPSVPPETAPVPGKTKAPNSALPDLVVTDIALDDACRLNVTVKNIGRGTVNPEDFQRLIIKITRDGAKPAEFFTAKLSKGTVALRPGVAATLATAIHLVKSGLVTAEFDSRQAVAESDEKNNHMRKVLNPHCAKTTQKLKPIPPKGLDKTVKPKDNRPLAFTHGAGRRKGVINLIDATHGISVEQPVGDRVYPQGSEVQITWSDARPADGVDSERGNFIFNIRRHGDAGEDACFWCGREVGRGVVASPTISASIPDDIPNGRDYYVRVYSTDNPEIYGDSDFFQIGPRGVEAVINLHDPPPCPDWVDDRYCHVNSWYRVGQPLGFTIRGSGDGAVIEEIIRVRLEPIYRRFPASPMFLRDVINFTSAEFSWLPPLEMVTGEDYRIVVEYRMRHDAADANRFAYSDRIRLNPPWSEPDTTGYNQIVILSPEAGDTVYTGSHSQLWVQWHCDQCADIDDLSYTRVLLKNGVELQRIGPTHAGGDINPTAWFNIFGYLSDSDYQVRIELNRMNYDTETPEMIASDTTGDITIINNTLR